MRLRPWAGHRLHTPPAGPLSAQPHLFPPRPHDAVGRIGELADPPRHRQQPATPTLRRLQLQGANIASGLGYRICTWTIDTRDWQKPDGVHYRSTSSIRSIVRTAPRSAKASGVVLGHPFSNYPSAISGIIYDLHQQGLLLCRNRGPVGRLAPFPLACT